MNLALNLRRSAACALVCLAGAAPASAAAAARTAPATLAEALAREVGAAAKVAKGVGVHVVDLAGNSEVYGHQAAEPRILASNTKLLTTAALIMSVYLIATTFATTVLIPADAFAPGRAASGRALAFHRRGRALWLGAEGAKRLVPGQHVRVRARVCGCTRRAFGLCSHASDSGVVGPLWTPETSRASAAKSGRSALAAGATSSRSRVIGR